MEQLGCHKGDFLKCDIWSFFQKSFEKIQVLLNSGKNNGYFIWRRTYVMKISLYFLLELEMFQTMFLEKIKTTNLCTIIFVRKLWSLWDNVKETQDELLRLHCKNGSPNAPQYYVMRTLPTLLNRVAEYWSLRTFFHCKSTEDVWGRVTGLHFVSWI
jgi:hypothetical protein